MGTNERTPRLVASCCECLLPDSVWRVGALLIFRRWAFCNCDALLRTTSACARGFSFEMR